MAKSIYVADDELHIRNLIQTFLANEGYEVRTFADGDSLFQAFSERCPDLIILDIMMPGTDGLSLCARIRGESRVPIMIVSAKDSPLDRVTGITLGSDDYMVKPFLPLELVARVKALFRRAEYSQTKSPGTGGADHYGGRGSVFGHANGVRFSFLSVGARRSGCVQAGADAGDLEAAGL